MVYHRSMNRQIQTLVRNFVVGAPVSVNIPSLWNDLARALLPLSSELEVQLLEDTLKTTHASRSET